METTTTRTTAAGAETQAIIGDDTVIFNPGLDMLGCAYNVLKYPYAQKKYAGTCVVAGIDAGASEQRIEIDSDDRLYYSFPTTIKARAANEFSAESEGGESLTTFSNSLAVRSGVDTDCGAFKGEVTVGLGLEESTSRYHRYLTIFDSKITAEAFFERKDLGAGLSLDPTFVKDLNDAQVSPSTFFERYGTHIISGIRIGGQIRFTSYAEENTYSQQETFELDAKAKYQSLSGSSSVKVSVDQASEGYEDKVKYGDSLLIYGGSGEGQAAVENASDYGAWLTTVARHPDFAEFRPTGLIPVWDLCDDPERSAALEATFRERDERVLVNQHLLPANGGDFYKASDYNSVELGSPDPNAEVQKFAATMSKERYWVGNTDTEVLVGFGATVNTDGKLVRILVAVRDLRTGKVRRVAVGSNSTDPNDYERWYQVPDGCVITGLGLRSKSDNVKNMVVYYQALALDDEANGYLDPQRKAYYAGDALSQYEISYTPPSKGNRTVVVGLLVRCGGNNFDKLLLKVAEIG